jgi:hypothetical protein
MSIVAFIVGIGFHAVIGWLLVRIAEGKTAVLRPLERVLLGLLVGSTVSMFGVFFLHVLTGLPLSRLWLLAMHALIVVGLAIAYLVMRKRWHPSGLPESSCQVSLSSH